MGRDVRVKNVEQGSRREPESKHVIGKLKGKKISRM